VILASVLKSCHTSEYLCGSGILQLRHILSVHQELAQKNDELESKYDAQFAVIKP
jgi:hypothetical protein